MKRKTCVLVAAAASMTLAFSGIAPVSAAPSKGNSLLDTIKSSRKSSYVEGEALVMLKTRKSLSTKSIDEKVGAGKEYSVEESWDFEEANVNLEADSGFDTESVSGSAVGDDGNVTVVLVKSRKLKTKELIRKLLKDEDVLYAEPNYKVRAFDVDDSYFKHQWGLNNRGQNGGTEGKSLNISEKWNKGIKGTEKVVAVVDTGINYLHEDLKDNMWENDQQPALKGEYGFDFANDDNDPLDDDGHGSHCAGIIGAKGNNGVGVSGVNQDVKLMALKVLDEDGYGEEASMVGAYHYINKALNLKVNVTAINNSWGGGESSDIFKKLVDIVGEKGAVSVCAAGNASNNNDKISTFPANIDSEYVVSVAAVNENNRLADFSNYGEKQVDLAAPGVDILSTVAKNCYNPSIYSDEKQAEVSEKYNGFENGEGDFGIPESPVMVGKEDDSSEFYSSSVSSEHYFGTEKGSSLKLSFSKLKSGVPACAKIPYTLPEGTTYASLPSLSMMVYGEGPQTKSDASGMVFIFDLPKGEEITEDLVETRLMGVGVVAGAGIYGPESGWEHLEVLAASDWDSDEDEDEETATETPVPEEERERELIVGIYPLATGDFNVWMDDVGISKTGVAEKFGKYDFYRGTSMAAPYVTGAVALTASELEASGEKVDATAVIDALLCYVDESETLQGKVATGGSLDFSKSAEAKPRIGKVTVDTGKDQITIKGANFGEQPSVSITTADKVEHNAEIVSSTEKEIVIRNDNFINRKVSLEVVGLHGNKASRNHLYLVNGKKQYTELKELAAPSEDLNLATDGVNLFCADSESDTILKADTSIPFDTEGKIVDEDEDDEDDSDYDDDGPGFMELTNFDSKKYFTKDKDSLAEYDLTFGKELVYTDGKLYNIVSYSEVATLPEEEIDIDDDMESSVTAGPAYSSQYRLMSVAADSGKIDNLGALPSELDRYEDYTLAAYNGKLYVIGGYDYKNKEVSKAVKVYDPATKKWSEGPALPEGRAGGYALQWGDNLVYTYGYNSDGTWPVNLILGGNTWKVSEASVTPNDEYERQEVNRSGKQYLWYRTSIGLCKEGIVYIGSKTDEHSDTFIYDVAKDAFSGSAYTQVQDRELEYGYKGLVVGKDIYAFDENRTTYKAELSSGLVQVKAANSAQGTILNANKGFMPGNMVTLTAQANRGYIAKSITANGKTVNGKSISLRLTKDGTASASYAKGVTKISLNKKNVTLKAGKTFKLKVKVTPKNAANKKVAYKSSNTKYATVSAKGVIKAKKAGKGKKVTITVTAKDGTGVKATCKVKISK